MPGFKEHHASPVSVAIICSHGHLQWEKIVTGILDTETLPGSSHEEELKASSAAVLYQHPWTIDNKYYTATVQVMVLSSSWQKHMDTVASAAEALLVYWDNKQQDAQLVREKIFADLNGFEPEVCLLVCDNFNNQSAVLQEEANEWCVEHGWELVELQCSLGDEDLDESELVDFEKNYGIRRIQDALQATSWSNMKRKQRAPPRTSSSIRNLQSVVTGTKSESATFEVTDDAKETADCATAATNSSASAAEDSAKKMKEYALLPDSKDPMLCPPPDSVTVEEFEGFDGGDEFNELFTRFNEMRITAENFSKDDRLDYAEHMAKAFMSAVGGKEDSEDDVSDAEVQQLDNSKLVDLYAKLYTLSLSENQKNDGDYEHASEFDDLVVELGSCPMLALSLEEELGFINVADDIECKYSDNSSYSDTTILDYICSPETADIYDRIEEEFLKTECETALARSRERELILKESNDEFEDTNKKTKYRN